MKNYELLPCELLRLLGGYQSIHFESYPATRCLVSKKFKMHLCIHNLEGLLKIPNRNQTEQFQIISNWSGWGMVFTPQFVDIWYILRISCIY